MKLALRLLREKVLLKNYKSEMCFDASSSIRQLVAAERMNERASEQERRAGGGGGSTASDNRIEKQQQRNAATAMLMTFTSFVDF